MQRVETSLPGVCLIEPRVYGDARGFFLETYHEARFAQLGITTRFVQDNHSGSVRHALRGLHYQLRQPQAKLCRVIRGAVLDVAVDIRRGSPHFGQWFSVTLSAENRLQVYIPRGFAHGFLVLSGEAEVEYRCDAFYDGADDRGVAWNCPRIGIDWPVDDPILSDKDRRHPGLDAIGPELLPVY